MNTLKSWFARKTLNIKITILLGIIIFIPIGAIITLVFQNLNANNSKQAITNLKYNMNQTYGVVQKTVELCNTSTQVFLNYQNLTDFLLTIENEKDINTLDLVGFYHDDIGMLENIVNSNPYLYQIRVYSGSDDFPEMLPILYHHSRLQEFSWSADYRSGEWQFDYIDTMSSNSVNTSEHTMGLITTLEDYEYGELAVIEVAVRMEEVFDTMFHSTNDEWECLVDSSGNIYSGSQEASCLWEASKTKAVEELLQLNAGNKTEDEQNIQDRLDVLKEAYFETELLGENVVVGILPMKELSGTMIRIVSMEDSLKTIGKYQTFYMFGLLAVFILLVGLINILVKSLLKHFYEILSTITRIQEGDLEVRTNLTGNDEMGHLGMQIDIMLDTIDRLMHENLKRELLMKNSEIKALQNQINAHFIYNVLEAIKMMAEIDEKSEISDAVTSLGKLLRYGMKFTARNVTVAQEIEYVRNYLELINLRFDFRINLALNISELIYHQEIPKITLQPIVENAFYHGIEELGEDASIYIKAYEEGNDFLIEITDSGKGMSQREVDEIHKKLAGDIESGGGSGNGIGLKNVQDRIRISFGENYGIRIYSKEMCYTKVVVRLPITHRGIVCNE